MITTFDFLLDFETFLFDVSVGVDKIWIIFIIVFTFYVIFHCGLILII